MANLLQSFKAGPLDFYRKRASFDWKKLKVFLVTEDVVKYQNDLYTELEKHTDFKLHNVHSSSLDEERRIATRQNFIYKSIQLINLNYLLMNLKFPMESTRIMLQFTPSSAIKYSVTDSLFINVLRSMGTDRHSHFIDEAEEGNIIGCYALTEIGHGSNTKGMKCSATYNRAKKCFVLHSENFQAAKCWVGGLGQTATHAVVYAQLILDDKKHGLHCFIVPIRDPKTLLPYPGLIVGDMGEKAGLNGIDNGFVMFNNYEIPRENLLNKLGDVTENGEYSTSFKDPNKRHGAALGSLSAGRVNIAGICETLGTKALTIAIRYAAVRKQFGPDDEEEVPILEYQSHQYRLLPYLASVYVLRVFNTFFGEKFIEFAVDQLVGSNKENLPDRGMEIHAVSSSSKPMAGWIMRDAIQECRETCGGHGYLKAAGISEVRNDHDANLTYEGENHVLIQQTSNWLLKFYPPMMAKKKISTPLKSADFLSNGFRILATSRFQAKNVDDVCRPENIINAYQWLVCYLLKTTNDKLEKDMKVMSSFEAKHNNQVFYAKNLGISFIQHFFLQIMLDKISETNDPTIRAVLLKIFSLFGLWSLEKHLATLYQGEFAVGPKPTTLIQEGILKLCSELKNDAVSLVDVIAPPDFILNSALGNSDGDVYKHLEDAIFNSKYSQSRPEWWQEITNWKENVIKSKL